MSEAERAASGIGVSAVAAVSAEAVLGKEEAEARTVALRAGRSRSGGGTEGFGDWKRAGWALSVEVVSIYQANVQER
jgi:hypothetical protein